MCYNTSHTQASEHHYSLSMATGSVHSSVLFHGKRNTEAGMVSEALGYSSESTHPIPVQ